MKNILKNCFVSRIVMLCAIVLGISTFGTSPAFAAGDIGEVIGGGVGDFEIVPPSIDLEVSDYTITVKPNGATSHTSDIVFQAKAGLRFEDTSGNFITSIPVMTRTGFTLKGYYDAASGGNMVIPATGVLPAVTTFTADTTLYAQWSLTKYTITLSKNGGTGGTTYIYSYYNRYVCLDEECNNKMSTTANPITPPTGPSYAVTYNANGGSVRTSFANTTASRAFEGYYANASLSSITKMIADTGLFVNTTAVSNTIKGTENKTWYAKWGVGTVTLPTPTRDGYTFNGWYTAASGGTKVGNAGASYTVSANTTLYAHWTKNVYNVTLYYIEGGCAFERSCTTSSCVMESENTAKTSCTVSDYTKKITGWELIDSDYNTLLGNIAFGQDISNWLDANVTSNTEFLVKPIIGAADKYTITLHASGCEDITIERYNGQSLGLPTEFTSCGACGDSVHHYYANDLETCKYQECIPVDPNATYKNNLYGTELYAQILNVGVVCAPGTYLPKGKGGSAYDECVTCTAGSYCPGSDDELVYCKEDTNQGIYDCPTGYEKSINGTATATECYAVINPGYYIANVGDTTQTKCPAGYYCSRSFLSAAGTYAINYGSKSTAPVTCGKGYYCPEGTESAKACPAGAKCATTGLSGYTICTGNTYAATEKQTSCQSCPTGYSISGTALGNHDNPNDCKISCSAGTYIATSGATCVNVGNGYFSSTHTVANGSVSGSSRGTCPDGGVTGKENATAITDCYKMETCTVANGEGTKKCTYSSTTKTYVCVSTCDTTQCDAGYEAMNGVCTNKTYTVTLNKNDGSNSTTSVNAIYAQAMPTITPPTRGGYNFAGYYDAASGGTQYYKADGTSARTWNKASTATLYARWTAKKYTIKYISSKVDGILGEKECTYGTTCKVGDGSGIENLPAGSTFGGTWQVEICNPHTLPHDADLHTLYPDCEIKLAEAGTTTFIGDVATNTFTIKYNANGGQYHGTNTSTQITDTTGCIYGGICTLTSDYYVKTGYSFKGWSENKSATTPTYTKGKQITATPATWGDTNGETITLYAIYGQCTACQSNESVDCTLSTTDGTCSYTTTCNPGYSNIQNNGQYNATCTKNTYTIKFYLTPTSSTAAQTKSLQYNDSLWQTSPYKPTRTGHTFKGLFDQYYQTQYYDENFNLVASSLKIQKNLNLYAKWQGNTIKIELDNDGAQTAGTAAIYYAFETKGDNGCVYFKDPELTQCLNEKIDIPQKTGYEFENYVDPSEDDTEYVDQSGTISSNLYSLRSANSTFVAQWTATCVSFKINSANGANNFTSHTVSQWSNDPYTVYASEDCREGSDLESLDSYIGYMPNADPNVVPIFYDNANLIKCTDGGDVILTGNCRPVDGDIWWQRVKCIDGSYALAGEACSAPTYTVTLNANGGSGGTASVTATYGSAMTPITIPTREGHTFAGYYDAASGGTQYYTATGTSARTWNKTSATTLYARWTQTCYEIELIPSSDYHDMGSAWAEYGLVTEENFYDDSACDGHLQGAYVEKDKSNATWLGYTMNGVPLPSLTELPDDYFCTSEESYGMPTGNCFIESDTTWISIYECDEGFRANGKYVDYDTPCTASTYAITLDAGVGTGLNITKIYVKPGFGWYSDAAAGAGDEITSVTMPYSNQSGDDWLFMGFFTGQNGSGTQVISRNGNIVAPDFMFEGPATVYAYYEKCTCTKGDGVDRCVPTADSEGATCKYQVTCKDGYNQRGSFGTTTFTEYGDAHVLKTGFSCVSSNAQTGYVCPDNSSYYTSCNEGKYMAMPDGTNTDGNTKYAYNGTPQSGNSCENCPENAAYCPGGTSAPLYLVDLVDSVLGQYGMIYGNFNAEYYTCESVNETYECTPIEGRLPEDMIPSDSHPGYTFNGFADENGDVYIDADGNFLKGPSSYTALEAQWTLNCYEIDLDPYDSTIIADRTGVEIYYDFFNVIYSDAQCQNQHDAITIEGPDGPDNSSFIGYTNNKDFTKTPFEYPNMCFDAEAKVDEMFGGCTPTSNEAWYPVYRCDTGYTANGVYVDVNGTCSESMYGVGDISYDCNAPTSGTAPKTPSFCNSSSECKMPGADACGVYTGYKFAGWKIELNSGKKVIVEADEDVRSLITIAEDSGSWTVTAQWDPECYEIELEYGEYDGSVQHANYYMRYNDYSTFYPNSSCIPGQEIWIDQDHTGWVKDGRFYEFINVDGDVCFNKDGLLTGDCTVTEDTTWVARYKCEDGYTGNGQYVNAGEKCLVECYEIELEYGPAGNLSDAYIYKSAAEKDQLYADMDCTIPLTADHFEEMQPNPADGIPNGSILRFENSDGDVCLTYGGGSQFDYDESCSVTGDTWWSAVYQCAAGYNHNSDIVYADDECRPIQFIVSYDSGNSAEGFDIAEAPIVITCTYGEDCIVGKDVDYTLDSAYKMKWVSGNDGSEYQTGDNIKNIITENGGIYNLDAETEPRKVGVSFAKVANGEWSEYEYLGECSLDKPCYIGCSDVTQNCGTSDLVPVGYKLTSIEINGDSIDDATIQIFNGVEDIRGHLASFYTGQDYEIWLDIYVEPNQYTITYNNLDGGVNAASNPSSYTVEDTVVLQPAEKTGFRFLGWFDDAGNQITQIAKGTTGEINLNAQWSETAYVIKYENMTGAVNNPNNKNGYNVTTETFDLYAPTKTGHDFGGWYDNENLTGTAVTQIETGSTGDKTFWAKWTATVYTCNSGEYLNVTECTLCPAGAKCPTTQFTYNAEVQGLIACAAASEYQDQTRQIVCKTVNDGYVANDEHTEQTECGENYWCKGGIRTQCIGDGVTGTTTASDATQCHLNAVACSDAGGRGTQNCNYNPNTGKYDDCEPCDFNMCNDGYYKNDTTCVICPVGSWCANNQQNACPEGYLTATTGASAQTQCFVKCQNKEVEYGMAFADNAQEFWSSGCTYTKGTSVTGNPCDIINNVCVETSCNYNYEMKGSKCVECVRDNALSFKEGSDNCVVDSCEVGYYPYGKQCMAATRECTPTANAVSAQQAWNTKTNSYDICVITQCVDGYHLTDNRCVANERTCVLAHGTGVQTWNVSLNRWNDCTATSCNPGYTNDPYLTDDDTWEQCGRCNNMYDDKNQIAVSSYSRECEIAACLYQGQKYILENNECRSICDEKTDETGHRYFKNGKCMHDCESGYMEW